MKRPDPPLPILRLSSPPPPTEALRLWSQLEPARQRRLAQHLAELIRRLSRLREEKPHEHL
jgi:hypothetical protein